MQYTKLGLASKSVEDSPPDDVFRVRNGPAAIRAQLTRSHLRLLRSSRKPRAKTRNYRGAKRLASISDESQNLSS